MYFDIVKTYSDPAISSEGKKTFMIMFEEVRYDTAFDHEENIPEHLAKTKGILVTLANCETSTQKVYEDNPNVMLIDTEDFIYFFHSLDLSFIKKNDFISGQRFLMDKSQMKTIEEEFKTRERVYFKGHVDKQELYDFYMDMVKDKLEKTGSVKLSYEDILYYTRKHNKRVDRNKD